MIITGRSVASTFLLGALGGLALGLSIGFGLRPFVPLLRDVDWLATIIAAGVYAAFVAAHLRVYGWEGLRRGLRLSVPTVPDLVLAGVAWSAVWGWAALAWLTLRGWPPMDGMAVAVLKIGSMFGRLDRAGSALFGVALFQSVVLAPLAEELFYRGAMFGWLRATRSAALTIRALVICSSKPSGGGFHGAGTPVFLLRAIHPFGNTIWVCTRLGSQL